jgi:hypothetical protein
MSSCSLAGRVNFGPLLVNLEFGERKGQPRNSTSLPTYSQVQLYIYTWIPGCWIKERRPSLSLFADLLLKTGQVVTYTGNVHVPARKS